MRVQLIILIVSLHNLQVCYTQFDALSFKFVKCKVSNSGECRQARYSKVQTKYYEKKYGGTRSNEDYQDDDDNSEEDDDYKKPGKGKGSRSNKRTKAARKSSNRQKNDHGNYDKPGKRSRPTKRSKSKKKHHSEQDDNEGKISFFGGLTTEEAEGSSTTRKPLPYIHDNDPEKVEAMAVKSDDYDDFADSIRFDKYYDYEEESDGEGDGDSEGEEATTTEADPKKQREKRKGILSKILAKRGIYYGNNDKPVTLSFYSILRYLRRFGYIEYVRERVRRLIKERIKAHRRRRKQRMFYRMSFAKLIREDIKSLRGVVRMAINVFQKFFRLKNSTGVMTGETILKMNDPRCGMKDLGMTRLKPLFMKSVRNFIGGMFGGKGNGTKTTKKPKRPKRHSLAGSKWKIHEIKYKITRYPSKFRELEQRRIIDHEVAKAFKFWSSVTTLSFIRMPAITPAKEVHIDIRWERGEHGDGDALDGIGKVLAHSYFPQFGGDAHFDDDEDWTVESANGTNVMRTVAHELGHSLGLDHSDVPASIMNPTSQPYKPGTVLRPELDDIRAVQLLYGSPTGVLQVPHLCTDPKVDTIFKEHNSPMMYVFKGQYYWKINTEERTLDAMYPKMIDELFPGLYNKPDAMVQLTDLHYLAFKDKLCYKYTPDREPVDGFPQPIKHLPTNVNTLLQLEDSLYAFKGDQYWQRNDEEEVSGPHPVADKWPKLRPDIDGAMAVQQSVYFFKDEGFNKYEFDSKTSNYSLVQEESESQKTAVWWFGCSAD